MFKTYGKCVEHNREQKNREETGEPLLSGIQISLSAMVKTGKGGTFK